MRYLFFMARRCFLTLFCKVSANFAQKTQFSWSVALVDFFLKRHGNALGQEAVFCMNRIREWQERAKKCVLAHHQFEQATEDKKETPKAEKQ